MWYKAVIFGDQIDSSGNCWIDVRDLAEKHVKALQSESAGGERMVVTAGPFIWRNWCEYTLPRFYISLLTGLLGQVDTATALRVIPSSCRIPRGNPEAIKNPVHMIQYDTRKSDRLLGTQYRSIEETTKDMVKSFEEKGWLDITRKA
jgi:nucleoside-diphosphate-sugar epimerase